MNVEDLYRLLRSSHVQAQGIVDTIDEPLLVLDAHGCVLEANRAFFSTFLVERDDTIGVPLRDLGNGQWNIPELTKLIAEIIPRSAAVVDYEVSHDFPRIGQHTFLLTARRLWKADDNSTSTLLAFSDVTEARRRERENSLLFSELRHRMTNLLGLVRALANQTETEGKSAQEYKAAFLGRFEALLKAQSIMSGAGGPVALSDLVAGIVGGLGEGRLRVSGQGDAVIAEKQVVPLTMVLHELAANALKYGAFSGRDGTVEVSWSLEGEAPSRMIRLVWRERCGFAVPAPTRHGAGTDIIANGVRLGLQGSSELKFESEGLVATIMFQLIEDHG